LSWCCLILLCHVTWKTFSNGLTYSSLLLEVYIQYKINIADLELLQLGGHVVVYAFPWSKPGRSNSRHLFFGSISLLVSWMYFSQVKSQPHAMCAPQGCWEFSRPRPPIKLSMSNARCGHLSSQLYVGINFKKLCYKWCGYNLKKQRELTILISTRNCAINGKHSMHMLYIYARPCFLLSPNQYSFKNNICALSALIII
jgi:hypothetical protein